MLSINSLLKILISAFSLVILSLLSVETWSAWQSYQSADRVARVAAAASPLFRVLNGVRIDRANTVRMLGNNIVYTSIVPEVEFARKDEISGLQEATAALEQFDFADKPATLAALNGYQRQISQLQADSLVAMAKPLAERPADLAQTYNKTETDLLDLATKLSKSLNTQISLKDPVIDQLFEIYNNAWNARIAAGDASLTISNYLVKGSAPPENISKQAAFMAQAEALMASATRIANSLPLTPEMRASVEGAKGGFFSDDARKLQLTTLAALVKGEKQDMNSDKWNAFILPAYGPILNMALASLKMAAQHAAVVSANEASRTVEYAVALVVALIFTVFANFLLSNRITKPLTQITNSMARIASGHVDDAIPGLGRTDEIGGIASAVEVFRDGLKRNLELEQSSSEDRAATERKRREMLDNLARSFEASVGSIVDAVAASARDLDGAAKVMSQTAVDTSHRSTAVAAAAEEASANVTVVASSAEELGASVAEISRQVQQSSEMSEAAVEEARATATIVGELSTAATKISEVLGLISTIAGQTNLLALNATIEAARAGEAGRGFAIVASEVKELANQTAKATSEISAQISAIQSSTERAVGAIGGIAETIQSLNHVATMITSSVSQQGEATGEIVRSIGQASSGTSEVTGNITGVARAAAETGEAANEVLQASETLSRQARDLRAEVDRFVATVRAA